MQQRLGFSDGYATIADAPTSGAAISYNKAHSHGDAGHRQEQQHGLTTSSEPINDDYSTPSKRAKPGSAKNRRRRSSQEKQANAFDPNNSGAIDQLTDSSNIDTSRIAFAKQQSVDSASKRARLSSSGEAEERASSTATDSEPQEHSISDFTMIQVKEEPPEGKVYVWA